MKMTRPLSWLLRWLLIGSAFAASAACQDTDAPRDYQLRVHCRTQEEQPLAGVMMSGPQIGAPGVSDNQGIAAISLRGQPGEEVLLQVDKVPAGYLISDGGQVRRVFLTEAAGDPVPPAIVIEQELRFRRNKEAYVILVAAGPAAGLLVAVNGQTARLNSRGAAALRYEGAPGEEIKVALDLSQSPQLSPAGSEQSFILPERGSILMFRYGSPVAPVQPSRHLRRHAAARSATAPTRVSFEAALAGSAAF